MEEKYFSKKFRFKKRIQSHEDCINTIEISPSGHFLASAGDDKHLILTHILSDSFGRKEYIKSPHYGNIENLIYPSENEIFTCGSDGHIGKIDLNLSKCVRMYVGSSLCTKASKESFDSHLLMGSTEDSILFYDERYSNKPINKLEWLECKGEFRKNSTELIVGSMHNYMHLYDYRNMRTPLKIFTMDGRSPGVVDCTFNDDGRLILATHHNCGPLIYADDRSNKIAECTLTEYRNIVTFKSFKFGGPSDSYVLAGFDDKTVRYWKIRPEEVSIDTFDDFNSSSCSKSTLKFIRDNFGKPGEGDLKHKNNKSEKIGNYGEDITEFNHQVSQQPQGEEEAQLGCDIETNITDPVSQRVDNVRKKDTVVEKSEYSCAKEFLKNMTRYYGSNRSFALSKSRKLSGFSSIINTAIMHKTIPLIFCAGVENCIYAFSPFKIGEDDEIVPNSDSQLFIEALTEDTYRLDR